ncbi:hypothetical protein C2S52_003757 [Perilla frutescens var. hirtella]|nr:hypothetical protein C2S51_011765 [Perilla frutescens var. frutescens]KAH6793280.1 hypothetical protein C2S52_003757 [Perilla frutescens var. hirtella]
MGSSQSLSQHSAVETINQWRSRPPHELIFDSGRREIHQYLQAIDKLQQSNVKGSNDKLISLAMDRLKSEFEGVLRRQHDHQPGPISTTEWSSVSDSTANAFRYEDYVVAESMNDEVVSYLRRIAEMMSSRGRVLECVKAYKSVRKPYLQSQLKQLRFDELRGDHNQRRYVHDEMKVKMELWIQVSKICVKKLFEKERELCGKIFENLGNGGEARDDCFVGTVKDSALLLFRFAEEMSSRKQPYDKMGVVLGVYDAFLWLLPSAEALFQSQQGKGIRDICEQTLLEIEKDVVRMLCDLQTTVLHEEFNKNDVSLGRPGEVHRSTYVVIDQIDHIVRNKNLLSRLINSPPSLDFGGVFNPREEFVVYCDDNRSFLDQHLILIILVLLKNLEMKARCYRDPSLAQLFVMNNVRCILKTIEGSNELQEMIGARFLAKVSDQLGSARTSYQKTTCDEFLRCWREEGLYINYCCFKSRPSKAAIKRRMIDFNNAFEKIKDHHSSWTIPDYQLRDEVRRYMSAILVPAYNKFLEKFGNNPETRLIVECNKKHSAEELDALVQHQLFANTD